MQSPPLFAANPEFRVLIQFLNPDSAASLETHITIPWQTLLDFSQRHSVRPLIHRNLLTSSAKSAPEYIIQSIVEFTRGNARRNTLLALELVRIVTLFRERGIPVATFKGPLLAEHVYGSVSLREFLDLDLIVKARDLALASQILREAGYRLAGSAEVPEYQAQSGQWAFRHSSTGYGIDLHWKLAPFGMPTPFSEDEMWNGLQELPLTGTAVPTLGWHDLALFLAFHGTKERWRSLKWVCDFSALSRARPELDWEEVRRRAARRHCSRGLLLAARLCDELGLPAPAALATAGRKDRSIDALVKLTIERLAAPRTDDDLTVFVYQMAATERYRDKAAVILNLLTTLTISDFRAIRLPARLRGLYYAVRPFRIAAKACGLLFRNYRPRAAR